MAKKQSQSKLGFQPVGELLKNFNLDKRKYLSREFQDYGLRLAKELDDEKRKSLYIKLAKEMPRKLLEEARIFVKDAHQVRSKARLFMWKLKELRKAFKATNNQ